MSSIAAMGTGLRLAGESTVPRHSIFDRISTWPMIGVLMFLAAHGKFSFLGYSADPTAVDGVDGTTRHVVNLLFEIVSVLMILKQGPAILKLSLRNKLIIGFPLVAALSILWSQDAALTFHPVVDLVLTTLLTVAIVAEYKAAEFLKLLEVTGFISTVIGLFFFVAVPSIGQDQVADPGAFQGIFLGKNICAMQTIFLMTPLFLFRRVSARRKLFRAAFGIVGTAALLLSRSRTGLALFLMMLVFMPLLHLIRRTKSSDRPLVLIGLGTVVLSVAAVLASKGAALLQLAGRDVSLTGRTAIWNAVWDSILKRPLLGYGYGAFWEGLRGESMRIHLAVHWVFYSAHNGYLEVWLQIGALGLGILLLLILRTFKDGFTAFSSVRSDIVEWSIGIAFLSVLYNFDESFFGYQNQLPWVLFMVASLYLSETARGIASRRISLQR